VGFGQLYFYLMLLYNTSLFFRVSVCALFWCTFELFGQCPVFFWKVTTNKFLISLAFLSIWPLCLEILNFPHIPPYYDEELYGFLPSLQLPLF